MEIQIDLSMTVHCFKHAVNICTYDLCCKICNFVDFTCNIFRINITCTCKSLRVAETENKIFKTTTFKFVKNPMKYNIVTV